MKKIVAKNVNRKMFMNLVKQMLIVDNYVTFKIDNECTDGISYLPMHDVIKNVIIKNESLFGEIDELEKPVRISFTDGTKLLNMFKNYNDSDEIDMVIRCEENDDDEEMYAIQIETNTDKLKRQEKCADKKFSENNITPLPDKVVSKLFSTDNSDFCFDISFDDMTKIKSLTNIDRFVKKFVYSVSDGVLYITERPNLEVKNDCVYDYKLMDIGEVDDCEFICNKNIFSVMSLSDFSVCVCKNDGRIVYEHNGDDETIRLAAVIITPTE